MIATLTEELTLSDDQFRVLVSRAGVCELPVALAARSRHATVEQREAAFRRAGRELVSRGLIEDGDVHPELMSVLYALCRPDRELRVGLVTPEGLARITVVRRETLCALARRIGDTILLRPLGHGVELRSVVAAVLTELPVSKPADIPSFGAPAHELAECLTGTADPIELSDRIRALGAEALTAQQLGSAFRSRRAFAEIVYSVLATDRDNVRRIPGAVAVYYSDRGRIIAVPSASPTGELWATLRSGTAQSFTQAVRQLVELGGEGWSIDGDDHM